MEIHIPASTLEIPFEWAIFGGVILYLLSCFVAYCIMVRLGMKPRCNEQYAALNVISLIWPISAAAAAVVLVIAAGISTFGKVLDPVYRLLSGDVEEKKG